MPRRPKSIALQNAFARPFITLLLVCHLAACSAVELAEGKKGIDVSPFRPGASRVEVETIVGSAIREWVSEEGIRFALYEFDKGIPGSGAGAAAMVLMDIAMLGVWELFWLGVEDEAKHGPHVMGRVLVSYDRNDIVLGLFNEFDKLPSDGRSKTIPTVLKP